MKKGAIGRDLVWTDEVVNRRHLALAQSDPMLLNQSEGGAGVLLEPTAGVCLNPPEGGAPPPEGGAPPRKAVPAFCWSLLLGFA